MVLTADRASAAADIDVLVIGAGACGLAAAIAAHDAGAGVAVIEKLDRPGGNSALSTGSVPAAGTRFQREAGIADSPERFIDDLMRTGGPTDCPQLLRRLVETSAATVEWLADGVGARIALVTAYKHVGHSVPRLHAPPSRRGQDLVDDLLAAVDKRGIPLAVGNGATALVADANGGVIGADIDANGERQRILARKTVLAVNGFAGNRDLVARFCPEISGAQYFGARGSTGEVVLWGEALGAALGNIGAYQGYAAVSDPHGSLLSWTTIEKGGIIVNGAGRRFGDESAGYSGYTPNVMAQGGPCFAIFDQRIFDVAALEEEFVDLANYGGTRKADTPAALATLHGLDPAALAATVESYNKAARGNAPDAFGRRDFALAPLTGALYICRVVPGLFHTQGGLMVDGDGRVLRPNGRPIANLFAGGGAAVGVSGRAGAGGYASGNGLLSAIGLGRLAGLAAAAEIKDVIARSEATKQSRAVC
jgi:fumarate reductase flavoprotein subunit